MMLKPGDICEHERTRQRVRVLYGPYEFDKQQVVTAEIDMEKKKDRKIGLYNVRGLRLIVEKAVEE